MTDREPLSRRRAKRAQLSTGGGSHRGGNPSLSRLVAQCVENRIFRVPRGTPKRGVLMRHRNDCFRAAVATCLDLSYDEADGPTPPHTDEPGSLDIDPEAFYRGWDDWARARGVEFFTSADWVAPARDERWIAAIPTRTPGLTHTLCMLGFEVALDPAASLSVVDPVAGCRKVPTRTHVTPDEIAHAITFRPHPTRGRIGWRLNPPKPQPQRYVLLKGS